METIHQILIEAASGGFMRYIGYLIMIILILVIPAQTIMFIVNRTLRHWTIRKKGYPPNYCDADGDFIDEDLK